MTEYESSANSYSRIIRICALHAAKKIRRLQLELPNREAGLQVSDEQMLRHKLACELADTIIYALIGFSVIGYDASDQIAHVFNQKSEEYGFPERAIP
jgi:hypothetical protein